MTHIARRDRSRGSRNAAAILVVEDDWLLADEMAEGLRACGYGVIGPAARASSALAMLQEGGVDAAFLDVTLGAETSFSVAHELAARGIPFLFMTGHDRNQLPSRFREVAVLTKPLTGASLRAGAAVLFAAEASPPAA